MVTSEYITSGILEQYVTGTATPQERQEVECMSKIYPELREELTRIEASLEAYITAHSVTPPAHLKAKIFDAIDNLAKETPEIEAETPEKGKVIVMQSSRRWQYLAAASVAGLALATSLFWSNYQSQKATLAAFSARTQTAETALQNSRSELAVLNNADFSPVKLSGIPQKAPAASMQVLWNKKTKEVYVNRLDLPDVAPDKQYQLWGLADGKPIDMGVFDGNEIALIKMKDIPNAQAFAVTLEPRGGSPSPTLTEMYVLGNI